jgi:SAM-dependent methyltransferase
VGSLIFRRVRYAWYWTLTSLKQRGVVGTIKRPLTLFYYYYLTPTGRRERLELSEFDSKFDVQTDGKIPLWKLGVSTQTPLFERRYEPTPSSELILGPLTKLNIGYDEFIFVDLGAGKGRALLFASLFPFKKIIGVEFAPELVRTAQQNLAKSRNSERKCRQVDILCMDAAEYNLPDEKAVIYLYNPFEEETMTKVLENIHLCRRANPKELYIIYANPVHANCFAKLSCFEKIDSAARSFTYRYRFS